MKCLLALLLVFVPLAMATIPMMQQQQPMFQNGGFGGFPGGGGYDMFYNNPNMGHGYSQNMGIGFGSGMGQGFGSGMGQGFGSGMGQGYGFGMGQGFSSGMGQGYGFGMGQGFGSGMGSSGFFPGGFNGQHGFNGGMQYPWMSLYRSGRQQMPYKGKGLSQSNGFYGFDRGYNTGANYPSYNTNTLPATGGNQNEFPSHYGTSPR